MIPIKNSSIHNRIAPYFQLAQKALAQDLPLTAVSESAASLPPIDEKSLEQLGRYIDAAGPVNPQQGWAVAAVIDSAARQQEADPILQAQAAWLLARAAHEWARPELAAEAVNRAIPTFSMLGETAWLVACTWQQNALPWTRPNFRQATAELTQALRRLEGTALEHLIPHCRLSLAFAQLLTGEFDPALAGINESEKLFESKGDLLNQARCWMRRSSVLRRQDKFNQSLDNLLRAQEAFQRLPAPVESAKVSYQLAYINLSNRNDYTAAEENLQQAGRTFSQHRMPLWAALCDHALGQVYLESGRLSEAGRSLDQARKVLADFDITGALGDVLFDSAKYARLVGDHAASIEYLREAGERYVQVGAPYMAALAAMHLGSTYREWGFYQLALHYLEQAQQQLLEMNHSGRLAECHMRLAHVWLQINRPEEADHCLEQALHYYEQDRRPAYLTTVYGRQAEAAMLTKDNERAISYLEQAVEMARQNDLGPQIAMAQQLLGETLCLSGKPESGLVQLQEAVDKFAKMGLVFDQAGCLVALGNGRMQRKEIEPARRAWRQALALDRETVPSITWRARGGLARTAKSEGSHEEALRQYRLAMKALNRQRRDFWQPDLAGTFLQKASALVDEAVSLAVDNGLHEDALRFVEAGKAQSVIRRLLRRPNNGRVHTPSPELRTAAAEIQSLYERIHARYEKERMRQDKEVDELIRRLPQKIQAYRAARSRWERRHLEDFSLTGEDELDIGRFRQTAQEKLGGSWAALSYFLAGNHLYIIALIDGVCRSWKRPITARAGYAIESCIRARTNHPKPGDKELKALGEWLFPDEVAARLTPQTTLIIAPHQALHQLPWAALPIGVGQNGDGRELLAAACIPVVVPSLSCLSLIWERTAASPPLKKGLLVGASEFPGRSKRPLPEVDTELKQLKALLGESGEVLAGDRASWRELCSIAGQEGLSQFAFCHIAGHASFDSLTGRLSGISLYDRDVWLDELWDCAPWPSLVTMAACNSSQSLVHEGDEHIGLTTTLLAAGANSVAGSIWPVRDEDAADLLTAFYRHLLAVRRPAEALALAQRQAVEQGKKLSHWGSFICVGQP